MSRKSLILYASKTGNTEKIALRFKKAFEKKGWQCDIFKIDKNTDTKNQPVDFNNYDFLCVGSPVYGAQPWKEIMNFMDVNPLNPHHVGKDGRRSYKKVVLGPKKGIVFVTYAGPHLGPKEAAPALISLEVEMEHLKFECIGSFACPGVNREIDVGNEGWHGDISGRPNERDLLKAEIFMEEKIEEID
jgi:hypothetical protein